LPVERVWTAGTPRRLVVAASGVPQSQPPTREELVGPPVKVAFREDGTPTKAAEGFARKQGVPVEDLKVVQDPPGKGGGTYVAAVVEREGEAAGKVLPAVLAQAALGVSFPKSMRWPMPQDQAGQRFARPVRWVVALLDGEVLPVRIMAVEAGRSTYGHPFLAPGPIELGDASFDAYRDALRAAHVLVDVEERRETVRSQVSEVLARHGSSEVDPALLDEVANLVEWPHAVDGRFDEALLAVPECVVVAAMTEHQRYFPVRDAGGGLAPHFVCVTNRAAAQEDAVREGNELVLKARLADATFFWEEDCRIPLADRVARLEGVAYLEGLGNNLQRTGRLEELAGRIAALMGLGDDQLAEVRRAAHLCKGDLLTGLVGEFPGLQGLVGRELALHHGEPKAVADAVAEHYSPAGADDAVPAAPVSVALALADKLDVMAGCFALGLLPTGSQDPYALRRNALGVLLILAENALELNLGRLIEVAAGVLAVGPPGPAERAPQVPVTQVMEFFRDRLYHAAIDRGFDHDLVRATLATGFSDAACSPALAGNVPAFWARLEALSDCAGREWWPGLVELVERTFRIQKDLDAGTSVREDLLSEKEEVELADLLAAGRGEICELFDAGRYADGAELYCRRLADPVHVFFDQVFVNVDDAAVRQNRKGLCAEIYHLFADRFADLCATPESQASGNTQNSGADSR
ncbi:MAG: glycine--tRNA ligase subunit beta, partial [Candidatus Brocadiia bacterium]|nr:glycine--tRNA ligase subunit beta [Candidatus Brocadiia bacterium]